MATIDVDERNFSYWLPRIKRSIEKAAFVSIDCEFLGLPSALRGCSMSLFDTPCDRYRKLRDAVCRFPPCQLGLVCYHEGDEGTTYRADAFCITLFKRVPQREYSFSSAAVTFLAANKFDFNTFALYGVNYCNQQEIEYFRSQIISGELDVELFGNDFKDRMRSIRMRILLEANESNNTIPPSSNVSSAIHLKRPVVISLYEAEVEDTAVGDTIWDKPISPLEEAAMLHTLSEEHPELEFQLYVGRYPHMFGSIPVLNQGILDKLLTEVSGVSQIIQHLSFRKTPLIGHNCLLDLMYIYNCFEDDLPESYSAWKRAFHQKFPVVIDTKFLAQSLERTTERRAILAAAGTRKTRNSRNAKRSFPGIPVPISLTVNGVKYDSIFQVKGSFHNAAFDAVVTGAVFIALAHVYSNTRCSNEPWPIRKLLLACREQVANRISMCMVDAKYCNMEGADAIGRLPNIVEIRLLDQPILSSSFTDCLVRKIREVVLGFPQISPLDLRMLKNELVHLFGEHRVDVRFGAHCQTLEVATSSASIYARVCSFLENDGRYCFVDGKSRTFEQRLCSAKVRRKAATHRKLSTSVLRILAGILVVVAVPSLAVVHFSKQDLM